MSDNRRNYSWTKQKVHELITLYEKHECLWNCAIESYKDREKRLEAVSKICKIIGVTKEQFAKKIHNLRNQLNFEIKKMQKRNCLQDGEEYSTKWEYFDRLQFLRRFITAKPSFESVVHNVTADESVLNNYENDADVTEQETMTPVTEQHKEEHNLSKTEVHKDYLGTGEVTTYHTPELALNSTGNITYLAEVIKPPAKKNMTNSENSMDELEIFGHFVTAELRSLKSEVSRKKLKRRIMQAILEVGNEEDGININIKLT